MTLNYLEDVGKPEPSAATIGFFDGVHLGHRSVIDKVVSEGKRRHMRSVVVTFDPHPREILTGEQVDLLTTLSEKGRALANLGIDQIIVVPFDRELSELSPEEFLSQVMVNRIGLRHLVVGFNHAIGKDAAGDPKAIARIGDKLGFTTEVVGPTTTGQGKVSSSGIRDSLISSGDVSLARDQLGRPYRLSGEVVVGDGRGRQLGYPTANVVPDSPQKVIPANGVYAVTACIGDIVGESINGVMNIGVRPTLTEATTRVLEVHLLAFDGDLYGQTLHVSFLDRVRDEKKFAGPAALRRQIQQDIVDCMTIHQALY